MFLVGDALYFRISIAVNERKQKKNTSKHDLIYFLRDCQFRIFREKDCPDFILEKIQKLDFNNDDFIFGTVNYLFHNQKFFK